RPVAPSASSSAAPTRQGRTRMIYGWARYPQIHGGSPMPLEEVVTEHFLARYRALLDAEDCAFDELEHAYEDGDRDHFSSDLAAWRAALARRGDYLAQHGVELNHQPLVR